MDRKKTETSLPGQGKPTRLSKRPHKMLLQSRVMQLSLGGSKSQQMNLNNLYIKTNKGLRPEI